jgi:serine/threonine protein kinase
MDQVRWNKIEEVFHSALEVKESERPAVLRQMCGDDLDLLAEVESLLPEYEESDSFLNGPLVNAGLAVIANGPTEVPPGTKVGPYVIRKLVARGGMADVYIADDTLLGRSAALKIIHPESLPGDLEASGRYEREVRAASAVSHPNVAHIYGAGDFDRSKYIAMEYVEGISLRELLKKGPIPYSRALSIASQLAKALSAAHKMRVVHRDIKPENIIVTEDGTVKILDFGIAKLNVGHLAESLDGNVSFRTPPGLIMGTIGYMSPEQVRGKETDTRTDIWSLGIVLYEMLTGTRPFRGDSETDTLTAILTEEPELSEGALNHVNPLIAGIVRRCLAKNPNDRFQSSADLAFALDSLATQTTTGNAAVVSVPSQTKGRLARYGVPMFLIAAGALGYAGLFRSGVLGSSAGPAHPVYKQITYQRGTVWSARFVGKDNSILYSATWNGAPLDIFDVHPPGTEGRPLNLPNTTLLSTSSKGEAAVLENQRYLYQFINRGKLSRVPIDGEGMREIAENVQEADWSPDGNSLAIVRWVDGRNRLEYPIGKVLFETTGYINCPRVSSDGKRVAYLEHDQQWDNRGRVAIVDADGKRQVVSDDWNGLEGLAWKGKELWFSASSRGEPYALYAAIPGGETRQVASRPIDLMLHDVAPDGRVLLSRAIQQTDVYLSNDQNPQFDISWLYLIAPTDYSADKSMILFTHFGEGGGENYSVYVRKTDGSSAVRLGEGRAMKFSPDARYAIAKINVPEGLVLLPTKAGEVIRLPMGNVEHFDKADWLPDGSAVVCTGNEKDRPKRTFLIDLSTGEIKPVTPEGITGTLVSPDGKSLVVSDLSGQRMLYSLATGEMTAVRGLQADERVLRWHEDGRSLLAFQDLTLPIRVFRINPQDGSRTLVREIRPANAAGTFGNIYLFSTPDAKTFVFGLRRYLYDLYVVEGLS